MPFADAHLNSYHALHLCPTEAKMRALLPRTMSLATRTAASPSIETAMPFALV